MPDLRCNINCCPTDVVITNGGASAGGAWTAGCWAAWGGWAVGIARHLNKPADLGSAQTALSVSIHEQAARTKFPAPVDVVVTAMPAAMPAATPRASDGV